MNNHKRRILHFTIAAACLLALAGAGCNKALDLKPLDQVSNATYWKTPTDYKLAANAFYNYLRTFSQSNGDGHNGTDLGGDLSALARGTNTTVSTDGNYNTAYAWIRTINNLLANASKYASPNDIKQYVAEAKFFRAYVYFDKLLTSYGGVILVDELLGMNSPQLTGVRASRDSTINFIISDLQAAIPNLPLETAIAAGDKGRVSQQAAEAFLGRVCLYEGTWQKFRNGDANRYNMLLDMSVANSLAVINTNQYSLFKPSVLGDSALKYLFILENEKSNPAFITKSSNNEYILSVRYESNNLLKTIPNQISFGALGASASRKMADMYLCKDGLPIDKTTTGFSRALMTSEFQNRDNRMRYFMCMPFYRFWQNAVNYHINWDWSAADLAISRTFDPFANNITGYGNQQWSAERQVPNSQEGYDYPTIRLAEVYLNYAEAVFERNGSISDGDLDKSLNLVRIRVNTDNGMPKLSNAFVVANGLDMRTEIRRERTVELQGEGFRMDDLKRWFTAIAEMNQPVLGIRYTGTEYATKYPKLGKPVTANGDVIADPASQRQWSVKNYLIPLPLDQLQLNPQLAQNPGW